MQIANFFSMNRLVLAPVFFIIYFLPTFFQGTEIVSVCILIPVFIYMEFTDFLDGFFARKYGIVSDFGKLFDPFADVLTNMTVFLTFVVSGYMPSFFFLIILFREMGMQFVRMLAISNGVVIAAKMPGKIKTVVYIISGGFSLFIVSLIRINNVLQFNTDPSFQNIISGLKTANICLYVLSVILSVLSFAEYLKSFMVYLKTPADGKQGNTDKAG